MFDMDSCSDSEDELEVNLDVDSMVEKNDNHSTLVTGLKKSIKKRLMHYEERRVYVLATILDPRFKLDWYRDEEERALRKTPKDYQKQHNPKKLIMVKKPMPEESSESFPLMRTPPIPCPVVGPLLRSLHGLHNEYLLFLLPFNESRGSRNTDLEEAIPKSGNNEFEDTSQTVNTEDQIATEDQADTSINEIAQEDHGQSFQTPRNPPKRARKSEDSPVNEAVNCLKSLTHIVSGKDENSAFGDFVANKMKTCKRPRVEISLAQRYINDILFRLDMGLLSTDIQSMYKSHTYPTSIPSHSPLPHSPHFSGHSSPIQPCSPVPTVSASPVPPQQSHFSGHSSPIQPCSPVPTVSASPVPPQQSHFSGHSSPIQPCSPVPTVSASPVPPQQSQSLAGTLNNPFDFLEL
ncbi:uncharacterized protein LOC134771909 [Penaeus indicus]|uniref:uncharacterized protein LOC134771909 n=1 Tax=Penaeus indicus TaxID=29960 RepID=UPI00300C1B07